MSWSYTLGELAAIIGADVRALSEPHSLSFNSVSTDTRKLSDGDVFFALKGERFDGNAYVAEALAKGAVAAVCMRGAEADGVRLYVQDPMHALQAFAAHHRSQYSFPVFALTGSCGKTTSKDFTAAVLSTKYNVLKTQGNLNNEIGCPLTLLGMDETTSFAVIEMGANHVGEIARLCELARPTESAITLIAPAHLEGFGSIENVAAAKEEIATGIPQGGTFYANMDNTWCAEIAKRRRGKIVQFGGRKNTPTIGDNVILEEATYFETGEMRLCISPIGELRLPLLCPAHATNVLLAVAVGLQHGITEFEEPLRRACAESSRFKLMQIGPLKVIDDTYNANPASMAAALECLAAMGRGGATIAALGDMLELGAESARYHREIGELAGSLGIKSVFARGDHARDIIEGAQAAGVLYADVFDDHVAIAQMIQAVVPTSATLLVKGSRGMRMERVIEALQKTYENQRN